MELLCKEAQKYNAFMGVHINGTESYPEAKSFDDSLVNKSKKGWDWLDASYYIDKRRDATSNNRMVRLQSLKDQVPSLNFIYCDVWYAGGSWDSKKLGREIHSLGLTLATEFPSDHESDAVWNHWAVDYDYGGKNIKGFNSQIVRFIRNHQKDTWIARHPILGGEEMKDFEGWQGRNNLDSCIRMTFKTGLPTKYLQHFPILKWEDQSITFENMVVASIINGERIITKDNRIILKNSSYLIPWNPLTEDKLYYWNSANGSTTWSLPESWSKLKSVMLYQLSDQGKTFIQNLPVLNGQITIQANANTPYVIYKKKAADQLPMKWGEGTLTKDPGFNNGNLNQWNVTGSGASVERNGKGQYELSIAGGNGAEVSQTISGLTPGTYYASVYAAVEGNRKATMGVDISGDSTVRVFCNSSLWKNYIAADSKSGTTMQRMYLFFRIPTGQNNARLFLKADGGTSKVHFDDLRLTATNHPLKSDSLYFTEDFENIPDGLYPFIKGPAGGINDPRTHLSELHAPYTQKGWNGKQIDDVISGNWSLKAHGEESGLLLQTIPQTLRFRPGKTYKVSFKHESSGSDYALLIGDETTKKISVVINKALEPTLTTFTFVASESGNSWFGIEKLNDKETDLVIDDLVIEEN
jgi:endo-alpha-N-acetylgalactosaminidase